MDTPRKSPSFRIGADMVSIELDVHAHLAPIDAAGLQALDGIAWDAEREVLSIDGHPVGLKPLFRPERLIAWMDEHGVERAWISAPPPLYRQHLRGAAAASWTAYVNDGLAAIAARYADRLSALTHLPIDCVETALATARHHLARGATLFAAPAGGDPGTLLSDAAYAPLWAALDAANAFIFFHPGECADGRLARFYLGNLVGNPYETTVAIAHLTFGGVFETYPNITFCFAHGGGATPALAGRFSRGVATERPGLDRRRAPPAKMLARVCVDCITHDAAALTLAQHVFGETNVLFGSDWPFPMGLPKPQEQLADLPAASRQRLFCDNPQALLRRHQVRG